MRTLNASLAKFSSTQELKRRYQRNMMLAEVVLISAIAATIGTVVLLANTGDEAVEIWDSFDTIIVDVLPPPPPIDFDRTKAIIIHSRPDVVHFPVPEAAPDDSVQVDYVVASQESLAIINSIGIIGDSALTGQVFQVLPDLDDYVPSPDSFMAVEELPQKLFAPSPAYPEIARKAGLEGRVWLRLLIGKDGGVRDVLVIQESGANAGFEEAAVAAAWQSKWRPALQNKQPVTLWVTYEVWFRLK